MKVMTRTVCSAVLFLTMPSAVPADEPARPTPAKAAAPTQEQLEERFVQTLTGATLEGRWCLVENGKVGAEQIDKYTIIGVSKLTGGETWMITARVQYGGRDFTVPFPVFVKWAGDTPVITVDDVGVPGGATYSARVLIHRDTYAGTWSGGDHGGLMSGTVSRKAAPAK